MENKVDEIEKYAYAKGKYRKLSEDINAVIGKLNTEFSKYNSNKLTIDKKMCFSYSKKEHGYMLLKVLEPIKVKEVCTEYFGECYYKLCNGIIE